MRGLICTVAVLALAAGSATARPSRPPLMRVPTAAGTDGLRTAVWADSGGAVVRVLRDDQDFGHETVLTAPDRCVVGGVYRTTLGYLCATSVRDREVLRLQDTSTGAVMEPPGAAAVGDETQNNRANGEGYGLAGIGAALVGLVANGVNVHDAHTFIPIAGGRPVAPELDSRSVLSLDTRSGTRRLCAPLTIGTHDAYDGDLGHIRALDESAYRPPWLVSIRHRHALLWHCGSRRGVDLGPATDSPVVTRRYAAWRTFQGITTYNFATQRTWHYALRIDPYAFSHVLSATDRRLWVAASAGQTFVIEP